MLTKDERKKNRRDEVKDKKKEGMRKDFFFFLENIKQKGKDKIRDFFLLCIYIYLFLFLKKVRLGS
jgi:hypothetical protein